MTGGEGGTIHIAPCSCELHVEIRKVLARAEKAEAEIESIDEAMNISYLPGQTRASVIGQVWQSLQKAEARVAELEKERHELRLAVFDTETLRVKEREAD